MANAMNDNERLQLEKMLKEYNAEETTSKIRELRHSKRIREDVTIMLSMKRKYQRMQRDNPSQLKEMCIKQCRFLYDNYTRIFHKLYNDEIDLKMFDTFLQILTRIETGELDQHEASFHVGKILKDIYVDSALRQDEKRDSDKKSGKPSFAKGKKMSWDQFKTMNSM